MIARTDSGDVRNVNARIAARPMPVRLGPVAP